MSFSKQKHLILAFPLLYFFINTGAELPKKTKSTDRTSGVYDEQLQASVNSFANYIKDHFGVFEMGKKAPEVHYSQEEPVRSSQQRHTVADHEKALMNEVRDWQEQWKQERKINTKLRGDLHFLI